ncbi:MAG: ATP-binding cassette domain-containing protein [Desulfobacteraceae bacterium]|jgi:lipopolysaccharide transport system ATP-binding protein|nr:MAG: ATP-binding cassette domain-containing protein [Desulfobacteraceae bacterium]
MPPIIKITNLSKQYRLGQVGTGTLRNDFQRWWCRIRGKEDPFLKIGEANVRTIKGDSEYVWALKDINLEVNQGEILGIIGKNGAGKSTLLKILSRVTGPTTGRIDYNGRIGSLLEVGTGFHPELTGRDNIFLNGAILGMTKAEIQRKLDEIIDFAGVARYVDTPVKRYSSGMLVRLGFAVAAHLEPEILVVDEVLAVGDAEFQKKAIGKMQDVSRNEGRTVLFVSHNMASIKALCSRGIMLENGFIKFSGEIKLVINEYIIENEANRSESLDNEINRDGTGIVKFYDFFISNQNGEKISTVLTGSTIYLNFKVYSEQCCKIDLGFSFFTMDGLKIGVLYTGYQDYYPEVKPGISVISAKLSNFPFYSPKLIVRGLINVNGELADWPHKHLGIFNVENGDYYGTGKGIAVDSFFLFKSEWNVYE